VVVLERSRFNNAPFFCANHLGGKCGQDQHLLVNPQTSSMILEGRKNALLQAEDQRKITINRYFNSVFL